MKKNFAWLLYIAIVLTALPIVVYVYHFWIKGGLSLSGSPADWAAFGDYIGGILGPVYASLAFGAVLVTIRLQNEQILDLEKRGHLEELQRLLASCSKSIDDRLDALPPVLPTRFRVRVEPGSIKVATILRAYGLSAISPPHDDSFVNANRASGITSAKQALDSEFSDLAVQYHQLVWCLLRFKEFGGGIMLDAYYKNRHQGDVCFLHALGYFSDDGRVVAYFDPVSHRPNLIP